MTATLDYSLLLDRPGGDLDGLLVEEFVRDTDQTTVGLCGLVWTRAEPRWVSSAAFSRALRTSADLLARVVTTDRAGAAKALLGLGGGDLPDETGLRDRFVGCEALATVPPLLLGSPVVPAGFRERRVYRVLFAKEPSASVDPGERVVDGDHFSWNLRRVGRNIAWALDVTVLLASDTDRAVGPMLLELTRLVRRHGLIPVTTERFA